MRLHISSHTAGMDKFTGVKPLRGYADSIVRYKVDESDITSVDQLISNYNINNFSSEFIDVLCNRNLTKNKDLIRTIYFVFSLFEYLRIPLSVGHIKAYALRLKVSLSTHLYNEIFSILQDFNVFTVQNDNGVLKYVLQPDSLKRIYAVEG